LVEVFNLPCKKIEAITSFLAFLAQHNAERLLIFFVF
jgi:hypothetical protein